MNTVTHSPHSLGSQHNVMTASPFVTPAYVDALDHLSTKLRIPGSAVEPTNAMYDDGLVPGVCRLYMEGRCRQGSRCFQVHANPEVVEKLRQEALEQPTCCFFHGAPCTSSGLPLNLQVNVGGTSITLPRMNSTNCLWSAYAERGDSTLDLPREKVCREHRRGLCRFGEECGFLHICREIAFVGEDASSTGSGLHHSRTSASASPLGSGRKRQVPNSSFGSPPFMQSTSSRDSQCSRKRSFDPNAPDWCNGGYPQRGGRYADDGGVGFFPPQANSCPPAANYPYWPPYGDMTHVHYGHGLSYSNSYMGPGMEQQHPHSFSRTCQSFSHHQVCENVGAGASMFGGPLLRPLANAPRRNTGSVRHNPYGATSLGQWLC